jgi:hypothetical protein
MQPNCQMQLFPTTFLSKTAHAAQQYAAQIKNSSCSPTAKCSYFQRLFYQKQLMQPNNMQPKSKTAHTAQLPNAAISNDFSIKNSSCSPNHRYAAISNDFSIKNSSCSPGCS